MIAVEVERTRLGLWRSNSDDLYGKTEIVIGTDADITK